jgi:16S rRNA (cytidine1402-2'-O)-methyltransferase
VKRTIDWLLHRWKWKTARKSIKEVHPEKKQSELVLCFWTNVLKWKNTKTLKPLLEGKNIGLMSEAGCPGVADPGAVIVKLAHEKGIQVVPLVGPSRYFGHDGIWNERPEFYVSRLFTHWKRGEKVVLKNLEKISLEKNQSQIFIETPYRNNKMLEDILQALHPETYCVLLLILLYQPNISKRREHLPGKKNIDLHNRPSILSSIKCFCRSVNYFVHLIIKKWKNENKKRDVLIFVLGILAFIVWSHL